MLNIIKQGLEGLTKFFNDYPPEPEIIYGLVAYFVEYRLNEIEKVNPIIKEYSSEIFPHLPQLVDNVAREFFEWVIWLKPYCKHDCLCYGSLRCKYPSIHLVFNLLYLC